MSGPCSYCNGTGISVDQAVGVDQAEGDCSKHGRQCFIVQSVKNTHDHAESYAWCPKCIDAGDYIHRVPIDVMTRHAEGKAKAS